MFQTWMFCIYFTTVKHFHKSNIMGISNTTRYVGSLPFPLCILKKKNVSLHKFYLHYIRMVQETAS